VIAIDLHISNSQKKEQPSTNSAASKRVRKRETIPGGGEAHALDDICNPPGSVAAWSSEQLHVRWIHPHTAGAGAGRADSSACFGAQTIDLRIAKNCFIRNPNPAPLEENNSIDLDPQRRNHG
jgi:hypothetical protein